MGRLVEKLVHLFSFAGWQGGSDYPAELLCNSFALLLFHLITNMTRQQKNNLKRDAFAVACAQCNVVFGAIETPSSPYRDSHGKLQQPGSTDTIKTLDGYVETSIPTYSTNELGFQVRGDDATVVQRLRFVPVVYEMTTNREAILRPAPRSRRREVEQAAA
jgi:hypothetical protein